MKIWSIILMLIFSVFIASCATAPPAQTPTVRTIQGPPAGSPVAEQPIYKIGNRWTYESRGGSVTTTVVDVDLKNGNIITVNSKNPQCRQLRDKNFNIIEIKGVCGAGTITGLRALDFPLFIGKSWDGGRVQRKSSEFGAYGYNEKIKATGFEKIKVLAGEFEAFKIERESLSPTGYAIVHYWYAPTAKTVVLWKNIKATQPILLQEEFQLASYK